MKDYPDKMTPEQARTFRDAVLNIVSQIPLRTYRYTCRLAQSLTDGRSHLALYSRCRITTLSSCGEQCRSHCPRLESPASIVRVRRHHLQAQWPRRYAAPPLGTRDILTAWQTLPRYKSKRARIPANPICFFTNQITLNQYENTIQMKNQLFYEL